MFNFMKKKKITGEKDNEKNTALVPVEEKVAENTEETEKSNLLEPITPAKKSLKKREAEIAEYSGNVSTESKEDDGDAGAFAKLLGETAEQVKDDYRLHEIRRFCAKIGKVNVRYELKDAEGVKIIDTCDKLAVSEILVSPAYLDVYRKAVNKSGIYGQKICALIDFPFGESTYKSKMADIKACLKYGVDGFTVVMPAVSVKDTGAFKSQMKKLGKVSGKPTGVAFSASELDAEQIKLILKVAEKTELTSLTFAFGNETEEEIRGKCELIRRNKGKTEIRILGNVCSAEAVAAVVGLGADKVLTPYADEIAKELARRFNIKKVKLL